MEKDLKDFYTKELIEDCLEECMVTLDDEKDENIYKKTVDK